MKLNAKRTVVSAIAAICLGTQLTACIETADQFGGEVLRVGGRSAVAAGENLAVVHEAGHHHLHGVGDRGGHQFDGVQLGLGAVLEVLADAGNKVHGLLRVIR